MNISLQHAEERESLKQDCYKSFEHDEIFLQDAIETMELMLERKDKFYRNIRRMIFDSNILFKEDGVELQVSSLNI